MVGVGDLLCRRSSRRRMEIYSAEGPQDEDPTKNQHRRMPKLSSFGSDQAKKKMSS
jgi:hypothetical protein